ncbi:hypothetical protein KFE25_012427 [Diacronema lutheri]|uniref:Fe2OG dioxygenase domain-containing protein n=2 Tax=Diacronema lutheri TaxID=2081491 RepID=A0A8J5XR43_DIALT|nr:hypothetical protein KFE25_012427 [Diacronema lutheri]
MLPPSPLEGDQEMADEHAAWGLALVRHAATGRTEWAFAADRRAVLPTAARLRASRAARRAPPSDASAAEPGERSEARAARAQAALDVMHGVWLKLGMPDSYIWWAADEAIASIGAALDARFHVVLDDFLPRAMTAAIADEVAAARAAGLLAPGALAGGRNGTNLTYMHAGVRGDEVGWFDGDEPCWRALPTCLSRVRALVGLLREAGGSQHVRGVGQFSRAMVACYPGDGARYVRHCDNACDAGEGERCNGRRLTAVFYLNRGWRPADGGELRIFSPGDAHGDAHVAQIAPLAGRLLLFFSDHRCPHEVLPTAVMRYAVTTWFFDDAEYARARAGGCAAAEGDASERQKIDCEIAKFERQFGARAQVVRGGGDECERECG